jgi:hypothetical protein
MTSNSSNGSPPKNPKSIFFFARSIAIDKFDDFFGDRQRHGDIALAQVTICAGEVALEGGQESVFFHRERSYSKSKHLRSIYLYTDTEWHETLQMSK